MLPFGVTISATVPQRLEIPEGLTIYPVDDLCVLKCKRIQKETSVKRKTRPCSLKLGVTCTAYRPAAVDTCRLHVCLMSEWFGRITNRQMHMATVNGHLISNNIH